MAGGVQRPETQQAFPLFFIFILSTYQLLPVHGLWVTYIVASCQQSGGQTHSHFPGRAGMQLYICGPKDNLPFRIGERQQV